MKCNRTKQNKSIFIYCIRLELLNNVAIYVLSCYLQIRNCVGSMSHIFTIITLQSIIFVLLTNYIPPRVFSILVKYHMVDGVSFLGNIVRKYIDTSKPNILHTVSDQCCILMCSYSLVHYRSD
jgi:hypothetical protein